MFKENHYVPMLKWKRAEQAALEALSAGDKKHITPLVQFVMPKAKSKGGPDEQFAEVVAAFEAKVPKIPSDILKYWGASAVFVDVTFLYTLPLKISTLQRVIEESKKVGATLIPVINLSDDPSLKEAASVLAQKYKTGICLRIAPSELLDIDKANQQLKDFLKSSGLKEGEVDILVDAQEIGDGSDRHRRCALLSQQIYNLTKWRTFIFASGAFPADLSQCKLDEENLIPRYDFKNWNDLIADKGTIRKPSFADYTIQYPIYRESTQFFHPSTSIKYALKTDWLIMKGKKQKFEMYLANANVLMDDSRFYGEEFSAGDKIIADKARHFPAYAKDPAVKGTGSTETWLMVGINHHLALTARQVANLL